MRDSIALVELRTLVQADRPITYGIVQPGEFVQDGVPLVRGGDYSSGWAHFDQIKRVTKEIDAPYTRSKLKGGDLVVTIVGANTGNAAIVPPWLSGANITQTTARVAVDSLRAHPEYVLQYFKSSFGAKEVYRNIKGGAQPGLNLSDLEKFRVPTPPLPEQRRIAEILRTWDEAIEKTGRLIAAKEQHLAAVIARTFETVVSDNNLCVPAKQLFDPVTERGRPDLPLLAVMQDAGVVRRDAIERRVVMPDGSVDAYKVVRSGDFVISLRSFEGGLELSTIEGLVSPAYTVLRPIVQIDHKYYRWYFKSQSFIGRIDRLIYGIRDGKQISFRDFGDMRVPNPSLDEQRRLSAVLSDFERELTLLKRKRNALGEQKRGMMQKLLTGEWPVNADGGEEAAA